MSARRLRLTAAASFASTVTATAFTAEAGPALPGSVVAAPGGGNAK